MILRTALLAASAAALIATPALADHHGKKEGYKTEKTEKADIVDTAVAAGKFETLVAALKAADLAEALKAEGPFTVFAPSDEAFAKLPEGTVETLLLPENKEKLTAILTYHVVPGKTKSKDLAGQTLSVATLNGAEVAIDGTDGVTVAGGRVVKADIVTSNGVIHVVDTVLMPPKKEEAATH